MDPGSIEKKLINQFPNLQFVEEYFYIEFSTDTYTSQYK